MGDEIKHLVSVIIPTFNSSKFIRETIESVLKQTYSNFEIIVVDDGSNDNTISILNELALQDNRISYFQIEHSGMPAVPRNFGIRKSQGDFVAFLDSDDLWVKNKLGKQIEEFEKHPDYIFLYSMSVTFGNVNIFSPHYEVLPLLHKYVKNKNELITIGNTITCSSVLIKKEALQKLNGFDEDEKLKAIEDYDLWIRLSELGVFGFIPRIQVFYRIHGNQSSADWQTKQNRVKYLAEKRNLNLPVYKYYRNKGSVFLFARNVVHYLNYLFVRFLTLFD